VKKTTTFGRCDHQVKAMKKLRLKHSIFFLLTLFSVTLFAQGEEEEEVPNTLEYQFIQLKKKSNNYQQYKVVEKIKLDNYWFSVRDTLEETGAEIRSLKKEVASLNSQVGNLQNEVTEKQDSLANQAYQIEHMSFLGMDMTKTGYKTFSWVLIFALLVVVIVLYMRFSSANKVTQTTRSEFSELSNEFEEHKQRTRERETKLKRELQTEINKVEEMKSKLGGA
jgi:septal ring factor EnvC (AmiA/AmiB activator)